MTEQLERQTPLTGESRGKPLLELVLLFLRLGITAFGGPAIHIAMYYDEVVKRRKWLTDRQFMDLLGATNLIPGPNSTEMVIHIGYLRAGWSGLIAAGVSFITPAFLIVLGIAYLFVRFGATPQAGGLLAGIQPVMIAVILQALWNLGAKTITGSKGWVFSLLALGLYFLDVNPILILLLIAAGNWILASAARFKPPRLSMIFPFGAAAVPLAAASIPTPLAIFWIFLKIGSVLYGSGYVLLAFLRADFVQRLGWLTDQQLLDAIAIGQVTPGPVFTTATFIGYILAGPWGGVLATIGIFLPSFIFVALSNPLIPRLRNNPHTASILDGVNFASLGMMAGVSIQLAITAIVDPLTVLLLALSVILVFRYHINTTWLVILGGLVGLFMQL